MTYTVTDREACTNDDCCLIGVDPELSAQGDGQFHVVRRPMFEVLFDDENDYGSYGHDPHHEECLNNYHYCAFGVGKKEWAGYSEKVAREFIAAFLEAHPEANPYTDTVVLVGA